MRALVTGAAGFIGSHLAEYLLAGGDEVVGVDNLSSYYNVGQKRANLSILMNTQGYSFAEVDLRTAPLEQFVEGAEVVYHLAAQPGVRVSWASFPSYVENNVLATQRLLDAARSCEVSKFVYASSSSVYGNAACYPTHESHLTAPHSHYGVTKLAGEHLVRLYGQNWNLPTVALRYFTVYGPRQRPDMAIYRLIDSALNGKRFSLYGDGSQRRDFTYVSDVVSANAAAGTTPLPPGSVLNIGSPGSVTVAELCALVEDITGSSLNLVRLPEQAGDVIQTGGTIADAEKLLGWHPVVSLRDGVASQVEWQRSV